MADILTDKVFGVVTMSSRSDIGRRLTLCRVASVGFGGSPDGQTVCDMDPNEPSNMRTLLAFA